MFGIGLPELIVILAVALIVVGPDKLPGLAKSIAKQVLELKKVANSLKDSLKDEASFEEKKPFQTVEKDTYLPEKMAERARQIAKGEEAAVEEQPPSSEEADGAPDKAAPETEEENTYGSS